MAILLCYCPYVHCLIYKAVVRLLGPDATLLSVPQFLALDRQDEAVSYVDSYILTYRRPGERRPR